MQPVRDMQAYSSHRFAPFSLVRADQLHILTDRMLQKSPDIATRSQSAGRWVNHAPPTHLSRRHPASWRACLLWSIPRTGSFHHLESASSAGESRTCTSLKGPPNSGGRALGLRWSSFSELGSVYGGSWCLRWLWTLQKLMETDVVCQTGWCLLPPASWLSPEASWAAAPWPMLPFGWEAVWSGPPGI